MNRKKFQNKPKAGNGYGRNKRKSITNLDYDNYNGKLKTNIKERNLYTEYKKTTEILFDTPSWKFQTSVSTINTAIKNEANGFMKSYFGDSTEFQSQDLVYNNTFLEQCYGLNSDYYLNKPKCVIDSSMTNYHTSDFVKNAERDFYYTRPQDKDELVHDYIKNVQQRQISPSYKFANYNFDKYCHGIENLLPSSSEYTTTYSCQTFNFKSQVTQTEPQFYFDGMKRYNFGTQTDALKTQRLLQKKQHAHHKGVQCNLDCRESLSSIISTYGRYVLLAAAVINIVKSTYMLTR